MAHSLINNYVYAASGAAEITPEKLIPAPPVAEAGGVAATLELPEKPTPATEAQPDVGVAIRCVLSLLSTHHFYYAVVSIHLPIICTRSASECH